MTVAVVAHAVVSTVRWAWPPARDLDTKNRAGVRTMSRAAGLSAGLGTLLVIVASQSSGGRRLLCGAGAVMAISYATWNVVFGSVMTQFALSVEKAARRSPGEPTSAS